MADDSITPAQRRLLFRLAQQRGFDLDGLRALTPAGSVSALTSIQAAALIDRLNAPGKCPGLSRPRPPRQRPGTVRLATAPQRRHIAWLRDTLGWTAEFLEQWLARRHFPDGRPMNEFRTADDARRVIRLLLGVQANRARRAARSEPCRVGRTRPTPRPTGDIAP